MPQAQGRFTVSFTPQQCSLEARQNTLARMAFTKQFLGDLIGRSQGEMLSCRTGIEGSAGYVALEIVEATLEGRRGSFVLQHSSTMNKGAPLQSIQVVPDSGTDELSGIHGTFDIQIIAGEHHYTFVYELTLGRQHSSENLL